VWLRGEATFSRIVVGFEFILARKMVGEACFTYSW